ncbi:MAG: extracellular solute-binding protein [Chloroflexi bacterium]|nr:MAG: extracellular solute-binding protein [Chloroflexota bacterium]
MQLLSSFLWMRRFAAGFALVSLALAIMASLAACGGSGGSSSGSTTSSGPVDLTVWAWVPGADKSAALWNSTHPNIHVNVINVGAGKTEYDKLFTAIKANNQYMPTFETTGSLVDLSQYGANSVKNHFPAWTWNQVTLGNAVYSIPQDIAPMGLWYRQDIFQKYNLPVPTTWTQYADDAAKLHAADPNEYITDFAVNDPGWFVGLTWQAGAQLFGINGQSWKVSINHPQAQQVASYWQNLLSKKLVKTEPVFEAAWYHDLQTGTVATWISPVWGGGTISTNAPQAAGKWRAAPIPQWQAGQTTDGNQGGATFAVFKSSKHPKEASEFDIWCNTNQQSLNYMIKAVSIFTADQPASDSPVLDSPQPYFGNQNYFPIFKQATTEVNTNFTWGPTINQVYNDIQDNFADAVNGRTTLNDALNTVQQSTVNFMQKQGFSVST